MYDVKANTVHIIFLMQDKCTDKGCNSQLIFIANFEMDFMFHIPCFHVILVDCRNVSSFCENCSLEEGVCFNCSAGSYLDPYSKTKGTCQGE